MNSFIEALISVSRVKIRLQGSPSKNPPPQWQLVLARALTGLVWALAGGIFCWLVPNDKYIAAVLAAVAATLTRLAINSPDELKGISETGDLIVKLTLSGSADSRFQQAVYNMLLLARPACIYLILLYGNWLWLPAAAALAMAFALTDSSRPAWGTKWAAAAAVTLITAALGDKLLLPDNRGIFLMGIVTVILMWLLPAPFARFKLSRNAMLFIGETAALILGLLGMAL